MAKDMNTMVRDLQHWLSDRESMVMQEERTRIARDLHDTVKQKMFALQMQLSSAKQVTQQDPAQALIEQALQLVRDSQEDLKSIIYALRPVSLEQKGLIPAMKYYVQQWQVRTGICVHSNFENITTLPSNQEDTLYNVFQELMANIERHSQAKNVSIILTIKKDNVELKIEDDGIGFDNNVKRKEGAEKSTGLQSIRDRLVEQDGEFYISRKPNLGTLAQVSIQIHNTYKGE